MRKEWILLSLIILILGGTSMSKAFSLLPQQDTKENTLSTSCTGTVLLQPDRVTARMSLTATAATAQEALQIASDRLERVNGSLLKGWNLTTTGSSITPRWTWQTREGERRLEGWDARIMLRIRAPMGDAGKLLSMLSRQENSTSSIIYDLSKDAQRRVEEEAIRNAVAICRQRAEVAAQASGRFIGTVREMRVTVNTPEYGIPLPMRTALPSADISLPQPSDQEVTARLDVTYALV